MKKLLVLFLAVGMIVSLFAGCTSPAPDTDVPAEKPADTTDVPAEKPADTTVDTPEVEAKDYKIAMLPKFKGENYFDGCYVGAQKAADDFGITLIYDGPNQSEATNAKQVEILNGFIAAGVDAIIVSPCDAEGIAPTLKEAQSKGIKIVTFDADTLNEARDFYVNPATANDIAVGLVEAAMIDLKRLGFGENAPARMALISGSGLDVNQNEWITAIQRYIKAEYPWLTVASDETGYLGGDIWTPGSDETAAQNAANETIALAGAATDGSQINAVIGTSSMSTPALAAAWNAVVGEKPQVVITGLATPLGLIDYILDENNPMNYGVLWDVGNLGYLSVEATIALLDGKIDLDNAAVFNSVLGDKEFVISQDDGGIELLLGAALVFGPDNIKNFNY
jgi:rhamnose transport system substrate-binding protein/rhamnose transport system permease protein